MFSPFDTIVIVLLRQRRSLITVTLCATFSHVSEVPIRTRVYKIWD